MELQANGPKVNFISSNEKMPTTHAKNNDCVKSRKRNFKRRPNGNQPHTIVVVGIENVLLKFTSMREVTLKDVFHVLDIRKNLVYSLFIE